VIVAVDDVCPTTATCHGLAFLEKMPPRKSEIPYARADTRARTIATDAG
jgi:hypothetical protein